MNNECSNLPENDFVSVYGLIASICVYFYGNTNHCFPRSVILTLLFWRVCFLSESLLFGGYGLVASKSLPGLGPCLEVSRQGLVLHKA